MANQLILIVDDEERMRKLLRDFLVRDGYRVLEAGDGEEALTRFFEEKNIALVLLDIMMPKMDGWEVLSEIRRVSEVPVIMLTARSGEQDEIRGFELGVTEYVTKPFSPRVLMARITALLKEKNAAVKQALVSGSFKLDRGAHLFYVDGEAVELSLKEFELMEFFMENEGQALSREVILNRVWNYSYYGDARTIDTHVKKLRSKIGPKGECIRTVWGLGYKFEAKDEEGR